jgi:single-strand DNA-binding protein
MSGINKVILVGHVGKEPEVKYLEGGVAVAKFTFATNETYKNKDNQKVEQTEWHNIVMWRGLAEVAEKYVHKGSQLYLEGRIRTRSYGEENNKKYFTEIVVDEMRFLGGPRVDTQKVNEQMPVSAELPADNLPF